jgi:hypothetical protein
MGANKPSSFEIVTKLLLPALALAALILGQIKGSPPRFQWALLGLTAVLVVFGFLYAPVAEKRRQWREQAHDIRASAYALPELRRLARTFAEFVDNGRADTLHYIVANDLCQHKPELLAQLSIPPLALFNQPSVYFSQRASRHLAKARELQWTMMEFHWLVGSYCTFCVADVFNRFPKDLEPALTPQVKGSLNEFQQRFAAFLSEYEAFVKNLEQTRPAFQNLPRTFARPKPLA